MENTFGLIGAITGVVGLLLSVLAVLVSLLVVRWQAKIQARSDRLAFLSNVIIDTTIDRASRQPFYDEYIAKKGNGTVVKFWLTEVQKEQEKITQR